MFRDISPLLRSHFSEAIAEMADLFTPDEWASIDVIARIESRSFILAAGLAAHLRKGFVKIRKPGKLPGKIITQTYHLEYGQDAIEMQPGTVRILIVDDVLATGGTLKAAAELAVLAGYSVQGLTCLIDLTYLNAFRWQGKPVRSVVTYDR